MSLADSDEEFDHPKREVNQNGFNDNLDTQLQKNLENDTILKDSLLSPTREDYKQIYPIFPSNVILLLEEETIEQQLKMLYNLRIRRYDLETLDNNKAVNDVVMDEYVELIAKRSKNPALNYPSVYPISCQVFTAFRAFQKGNRKNGLSIFFTKDKDPFAYDILVFPINNGKFHWKMVLVDVKKRVVSALDSLGYYCDDELIEVYDILKQMAVQFGKDYGYDEWSLVTDKSVPQQHNAIDCGVFASQYANYICAKRPCIFIQDRMAYFRKKMKCEILSGQLLDL